MTRTVLVTRHPADCRPLADALRPHGIVVRPFPVMVVRDREDEPGWRQAAAALDVDADRLWIALASPRAPERLVRGARDRGLDRLQAIPVAAVGPATAEAAEAAGLEPAVVGDGGGRELAEILLGVLRPSSVVIVAGGHDRRPELPRALAAAGHRVVPLVLYEMVATSPRELPPLPPSLDAVVVTSPRAARLYLDGVGGHPLPCQHWALGTTTRDAAAAMGIDCRIPTSPDLDALAGALAGALPRNPKGDGPER